MKYYEVSRHFNGMFIIEEKEGENPKDKTGPFDTLDEAIDYVRVRNNSTHYIIRLIGWLKEGREKYVSTYAERR